MCQIRPIDERQTALHKKKRYRLCNKVRSKIEKRKQSLYICNKKCILLPWCGCTGSLTFPQVYKVLYLEVGQGLKT